METLIANWEWLGLGLAGLLYAGANWKTIAGLFRREASPAPVLSLVEHYQAIDAALVAAGETGASEALEANIQPALGRIVFGGRDESQG